MSPRRNGKTQNGEIPLSIGPADVPVPEGRIEMGTPPEIDITADRIGALFTERRRALGLRIEEVAEDIKVKAEYLRAIEREEFSELPTPQYARLFVRAYAERLGFNIAEVYALLDVNVPALGAVASAKAAPAAVPREPQLSGPPPVTHAATPDFPKRQSRTAMLWWGIGLSIVILTIVGWIVLNQGQSPQQGSQTPVRQTPAQTASSELADRNVVPPEDEPPVDVSVPGRFELVLQFDSETWAALRADGVVVDSRIFAAGEELTGLAESEFRLSLGHTAGVSAFADGKPLRPFADMASRLESYLITRDSVAAWIDTSAAAASVAGETTDGSARSGRQDSAGVQ